MTFDAKACPSCGRVPAMLTSLAGTSPTVTSPVANAIDRMNRTPYPVDWEVEPLPDGTVLLHRTAWGRARSESQLAISLIFLPVILASIFMGRRGVAPNPAMSSVVGWYALVAIILVAIAAIVWMACGREEIRVGENVLVVSRRLWFFESKKRVEGMAVLRVRTYSDTRSETRELVVENLGASLKLDQVSRREHSFLAGTIGGLGTGIADAVTSLGRFLSAQTGWPLVGPGTAELPVAAFKGDGR